MACFPVDSLPLLLGTNDDNGAACDGSSATGAGTRGPPDLGSCGVAARTRRPSQPSGVQLIGRPIDEARFFDEPHALRAPYHLLRLRDMQGRKGFFAPNFITHDWDPFGHASHRALVDELLKLKRGVAARDDELEALLGREQLAPPMVRYINRWMGLYNGGPFIVMRDGELPVKPGPAPAGQEDAPRTLKLAKGWRVSPYIEVETLPAGRDVFRARYADLLGAHVVANGIVLSANLPYRRS